MKKFSRQKLAEKNIDWEQIYTKKTAFLKKMFNDIVGPGSYFRFEGTSEENNDYYAIYGPAKIHEPIAKFFAGVRKLPAEYSLNGKYFDSLDEAAEYARETWGIPVPKELRPYNAVQIHDIKRKVEKWKENYYEDE